MFRSSFKTTKPPRDSERDIKQRLDSLVSLITRLLTPYCVLCGANNFRDLECMHFWHRAMMPTRYDLDNLATGCRRCNQLHESDPSPYRHWLVQKLGERGFADLAEKAHSNQKVGYLELCEKLSSLELMLSEIKERVA